MKTASCWFPALRECEGLGFIPPSRATEERGCFGVEGELEGKGGGKNERGEGVNREGIRGSALPTTSPDFEAPVSSGFGDGAMGCAVCPEPQHQLCAGRLPSTLLGRGSIDPSARRQLEHIWLPDEGGSSQPGGS